MPNIPASSYGPLVLTLLLSTKHWPYEKMGLLNEKHRIQTLFEQYQNLLEFDLNSKCEPNFASKLAQILSAQIGQLTCKVQASETMKDDTHFKDSGLTPEEMNWVIHCTNTVKDIFKEKLGDQNFNFGMEQLRKGNFTLETYGPLKMVGQRILSKRFTELWQRLGFGQDPVSILTTYF